MWMCEAVEAADTRTAHNNGWNGVASNTWKPPVYYHSTPAITMSPSSPIKVPPTSCGVKYEVGYVTVQSGRRASLSK